MTLKAGKPRPKAREDKHPATSAPAGRESKASAAPGMVDRVQTFIRESRSELRKVTWPTREQATNLTLIVIATSVAVGVFLGAIDFVLGQLFSQLFG